MLTVQSAVPSARILYIEDDLITAARVQALLDKEGYIVDLANNGKEGFAKIRKGQCDVVIIDYHLPDMDGLQILKKIKSFKLPAIMVTGAGDERIAVEAMKLGVGDYLIKDVTCDYFALLPSVIQRVLEKQKLFEEKNYAEESLHYREAILTAVSFAAEKFLSATRWEDHIQAVLKRLGQAIAISRVYIFENQLLTNYIAENIITLDTANPPLIMKQRYQWVTARAYQHTSELDARYYCEGFSRWQQQLSQGYPIYGLIEDFPEPEATLLTKQAILSTAIIPIFVGNEWWGFMGFDDCVTARPWFPIIIETLKIAANTLGAAIRRAQIEETLRQSEERVRSFIESVDDIIYFQTLTGDLFLFNTIVTRLTGHTVEAFTANPQLWRELVHPDDLKIIEHFFAEYPHGISSTAMEYRLRTQTGEWRWIHSLMIGSRNTKGNYIGYNCIGRDITERKRTEAALKKEHDFTEAILTTGAGLIVVLDRQGHIIRFNQACEKLTGYTANEVGGHYIWDIFIPPREISEVKKTFQSLITDNKLTNQRENHWVTKDGDLKLIAWSNSVLLDEQGQVEYAIGTGIDITERKQIEEALRDREQTLRAILEATKETIAMVEQDTTYVMINPTGAQQLQLPVNEIIGKRFQELFPPEIAGNRQAIINEVINTDQAKQFEDQEGTLWFEHSFSPVFDKQGIVNRVAIISRDITRRKEIATALLESKRRYKSIFDSLEVSIWEEDLYDLLQALKTLRAEGITDLRDYLQANPDVTHHLISLIKVRNVNEATLRLFNISTKEVFLDNIGKFFVASTVDAFIKGLCAIWEGKNSFQIETIHCTLEGRHLTVVLSTPIPEIEQDFHHVPVSILDITERKQVEQALQESEKKYRTIINLTSEGYWLIEPATKTILEVNESLCQMLNYTQQDIIGKTLFDFVHQDYWETLKAQTTCIEGTDHYNAEIVLESKDGMNIVTNFNATMICNNQGQAISAFAFMTDITARKQTETSLARILAEQEVILNNSMVGIAFISPRRRLRRFNRKLTEIFGYAQKELEGQKTQRLYASIEDYAKVGRDILKSFHEGKTYTIECLMRRRNGESFWARMFNQRIDSQDLLKGYIWTVEDITERKHADENLQLAATIFETVSEAIFVTDADNKILMVNPAFTIITGYGESDVLGMDPKILSSGRHREEFYVEMWNSLNENGRWQGEIWNRRKNGEVYPEWLSITRIKDEETRLEQHVAIFSDITKRKHDEAIIQHQANFDALTELPNRILFMDRLTQEVHHVIRQKKQLALMFIDLDHFKWVNDNLGHSAGDQLLQQVASRLTMCVRVADTVARLGGDEFTAILPNIETIWNVKAVAERILNQLTEPFTIEGQEVFISGSIGIALFPQDGRNVDTLIKNADLAMFHAKKGGRSAYQFFTAQMNTQVSEQRRLEKRLRGALENEEMILHYQPFVDLESGQIVGVEALLRWQRPEGKLWFPAQFIDTAEDIGLMIPIAQWSLTTAFKQLKIWHNTGLTSLQIAINLSVRQFKSRKIYETIFELLQKQKLPPHCIIIEVTERLILDDLAENIKRIRQFVELGVQIAIDDFGTDYSSLQYIRHFPFNILKIDPAFTRNPTTDIYGTALTEAIIMVAHKLKIKVVGEGIETHEQMAFLQEQRCDMVQGNYFSKPLVAEHFGKFIQTWQKEESMKNDVSPHI
jgi:diguanylate cyclase (GGDEF)-like protein/PAS domain S-box-containing protein